jgi:GntR family transcriptional regulator/MocR family aminotransferase
MPRQLEIRLQDGGMHFVARLRGRTNDIALVERLRRKGIGPGPLSLHTIRRNAPTGLMIGYPNVASADAAAAAQRMLAAMR